MTFIFVLAYLALIALTSVGFISATSDWGDFLNLSLGANLWGLVALAAAAGAVMALFGLGGRIDFRSRGVTKLAYVVLFFGHCLLVVAALAPAALAFLGILAGGVTLGYIASLLAVVVLALPLTPLRSAFS